MNATKKNIVYIIIIIVFFYNCRNDVDTKVLKDVPISYVTHSNYSSVDISDSSYSSLLKSLTDSIKTGFIPAIIKDNCFEINLIYNDNIFIHKIYPFKKNIIDAIEDEKSLLLIVNNKKLFNMKCEKDESQNFVTVTDNYYRENFWKLAKEKLLEIRRRGKLPISMVYNGKP